MQKRGAAARLRRLLILVLCAGLLYGVFASSASVGAVADGRASLTTVQGCSQTYFSLIPLPDPGTGTYAGSEGGLYPGGSSVRPPNHETAGIAAAGQIQLLDASGNPDAVSGSLVLISIGMSNTSTEFGNGSLATPFKPRADADLKPHLDTQRDPHAR